MYDLTECKNKRCGAKYQKGSWYVGYDQNAGSTQQPRFVVERKLPDNCCPMCRTIQEEPTNV